MRSSHLLASFGDRGPGRPVAATVRRAVAPAPRVFGACARAGPTVGCPSCRLVGAAPRCRWPARSRRWSCSSTWCSSSPSPSSPPPSSPAAGAVTGRSALLLLILWWMYGGYAWLTNAAPPVTAATPGAARARDDRQLRHRDGDPARVRRRPCGLRRRLPDGRRRPRRDVRHRGTADHPRHGRAAARLEHARRAARPDRGAVLRGHPRVVVAGRVRGGGGAAAVRQDQLAERARGRRRARRSSWCPATSWSGTG